MKQSFRTRLLRGAHNTTWRFIPLIVLFTSTLILTFSRSAWLALTIGLVVFLGQACFYKKRIPYRTVPFLSVGLITILFAVFLLRSHVFARFNPALHIEAISIEERVSQYQTFSSVFKIDPIFGVGPGAYVFALESISKGQQPWSYQPIHNAFLLLLAEIGIVGFMAFSYFVFEIGRIVLPPLAKGRAGVGSVMGGIFALTLLLELVVLALFDHYLFSLWPGMILTALILALTLRLCVASTKTA